MDKKNEQGPEGYEPPGFDEVLSAEDLEREIQYAGITISGAVGQSQAAAPSPSLSVDRMAPDGALRRKEDVWSRPVGDRAVLYSWEGGRAIVLNPTGAVLWEALKTPRTAAELGDILVDRFPGLPVERARADAGAYLERLFEENLLRSEPRAPSIEVGKTIDSDIGGQTGHETRGKVHF